VIREARFHAGMDAPAHEFMGQIEQESRCIEGITAFDGGKGLGQFMPKTAEEVAKKKALQEISKTPLPYDPSWAIRALILYDLDCFKAVVCPSWHFAFRAYNGGASNLNREIRKANSCDPDIVAGFCSRKILTFKWGKLDLCEVNCNYPKQIKKAGEKYKERMPWISA
jgi:soluble lytic murein transglycosylase-like protein